MHLNRQPRAPALVSALAGARQGWLPALASGIGGGLAIWLLAFATESLGQLLLIAPFGASAVLLFALPQSPLARPRNVIGGHLLSAFVGLAVLSALGGGAVACRLGVGLAIFVMQMADTLHPPAGADPLVVILTGAGWSFLGLPVLAGAIVLVALAWLYHRLVSGRAYPVSAPQGQVVPSAGDNLARSQVRCHARL